MLTNVKSSGYKKALHGYQDARLKLIDEKIKQELV